MDLQLRNSIYQCNPRCSIGKRHPKTSTTSTAAAATQPPSTMDSTTTKYGKSSLLERFERERSERQQRTNYLNETVSMSIIDLNFGN